MRISTKVRFEAGRYFAIAALALLVALFGFGPSTRHAHAADAPTAQKGNFKAEIVIHFSGDLLVLEEGHSFWRGDGKGVVMNAAGSGFLHHASIVMSGIVDINGAAVSNDAYAVIADQDGDKVFCRFSLSSKEGGAGAAIEGTSGHVELQGGTGKYKGVKGRAKATYRDIAVREAGAIVEGEGVYTLDGQWARP
jgi:hypothetical protein